MHKCVITSPAGSSSKVITSTNGVANGDVLTGGEDGAFEERLDTREGRNRLNQGFLLTDLNHD